MALILTEEQNMLASTAREFVRANAPVSALRALRDAGNADGFDRSAYQAMVELGFSGLIIPEELGGLGLGFAELGIVQEELGRELTASPLFSSLALGASTLLVAGDKGPQACLTAVAEGDHLLTLAYQEGPRHSPWRCETRAEPSEGGYVLRGEKHFVIEARSADTLLVVARTAGEARDREGLTLFALDRGIKGLSESRLGMVDSRSWSHLRLDGVRVAADRVVGPPGGAADILDTVFDRASVALAAEMLGGAQAAFDMTVEYLKTRKQFGVVIGSFQALKHRAADLYTELALLRSSVLDGLRAVDEGRADASTAACIAKARASEVYQLATSEGVQMHGGIGVTDEADIGFYFKRARTTEMLLGDAAYHRERFATLSGF